MLIVAASKAAAVAAFGDGGADWKFWVGVGVGLLGFAGVIVTLAVNGWRAECGRRRQLYASGWAAVQAYKEFAFAVRRRNADDRAGERVRISAGLGLVQRDLAYHEALIAREPSRVVASRFRDLVDKTRKIAGGIIRRSWNEEPITADRDMHAPDIAQELQALKPSEDAYLDAVNDDVGRRCLPNRKGRGDAQGRRG